MNLCLTVWVCLLKTEMIWQHRTFCVVRHSFFLAQNKSNCLYVVYHVYTFGVAQFQ